MRPPALPLAVLALLLLAPAASAKTHHDPDDAIDEAQAQASEHWATAKGYIDGLCVVLDQCTGEGTAYARICDLTQRECEDLDPSGRVDTGIRLIDNTVDELQAIAFFVELPEIVDPEEIHALVGDHLRDPPIPRVPEFPEFPDVPRPVDLPPIPIPLPEISRYEA